MPGFDLGDLLALGLRKVARLFRLAARSQADSAQRRMTIAILSCAGVAILFSLRAQRWILDPIRRLIESANEVRRGNPFALYQTLDFEMDRAPIVAEYKPGELKEVRQHDGSILHLHKAAEHYDPSDRVGALSRLLESERTGDVLIGISTSGRSATPLARAAVI